MLRMGSYYCLQKEHKKIKIKSLSLLSVWQLGNETGPLTTDMRQIIPPESPSLTKMFVLIYRKETGS